MALEGVNPGLLRKYLYEYVLLALVSCVVYLFLSLDRLNEFMRRELIQQRIELVKTVEYNSSQIGRFLDYQKK